MTYCWLTFLSIQSFIDQRASLETNQGFQSLQPEEGNLEAVEEDKSNNIEAEDPTASSPFPSLFNVGFPALGRFSITALIL